MDELRRNLTELEGKKSELVVEFNQVVRDIESKLRHDSQLGTSIEEFLVKSDHHLGERWNVFEGDVKAFVRGITDEEAELLWMEYEKRVKPRNREIFRDNILARLCGVIKSELHFISRYLKVGGKNHSFVELTGILRGQLQGLISGEFDFFDESRSRELVIKRGLGIVKNIDKETIKEKKRRIPQRVYFYLAISIVLAVTVMFLLGPKSDSTFFPDGFDISNQDTMSDANIMLMEFPEEIPGAMEIRKYITPGAKHVIVHIRQIHLIKDTPTEFLPIIRDVQTSIYSILTQLIHVVNLHQVYTEGLSEELEEMGRLFSEIGKATDEINQPRIEALLLEIELLEIEIETSSMELENSNKDEERKELQERINSKNEQIKVKKEEINKLKQESKEKAIRKAGKFDEVIEKGAVQRLVNEGRLRMTSAETFTGNILGTEENSDEKDRMDSREDITLKLISQNNDELAVVVYGGGHAWGGEESFGSDYDLKDRDNLEDNIAKWNRENPNKKFSLIEITPEGYW